MKINSYHFKIAILFFFIFILKLTPLYAQKNVSEGSDTTSKLIFPIYSLYYSNNIWELTKVNEAFLDTYILGISDLKLLNIYLEGHADDLGSSRYNMSLSRKRVQAVAAYLIKKGFDPTLIEMANFGESKPETRKIAVSNRLMDVRSANRRVTISINSR